jgi:hypothetical protein
VILPIVFTFVFGTFTTGSISLLLGVAMIRLLQNNLPLPEWVTSRQEPNVLGMNTSPTRHTGKPQEAAR